MPRDSDIGRRSFLKGTAGAAAGATLTGQAAAKIDSENLELDGEAQEAIVVFRSREDVDRLGDLSLPEGYYRYQALPFGYTKLTGPQIRRVAGWPEVEYVQGNHEIEWHNADAREATGVEAIQRSQYTGESVHVAVVDSGIDGDHPAFDDTLENNYRFANPFATEMWEDVGPANTGGTGHGTHVSGTFASEEAPTPAGQVNYGMAPDATISVYSCTIGLGLVGVTGAYDDIIAKQRRGEHDIQVINNSYGASAGNDYDPSGAHERATWLAYEEGILSVFSAGNAGDDTNTMGDYAAGPHLMSSAATNDIGQVTGFSSRGRSKDNADEFRDGANWDRQTALEQVQAFYDAGLTTKESRVQSVSRSGTLGAAGAGLVPIVENPESPATGSSYEKIEADSEATLMTLAVGWTPDADNDVYLRKGTKDGEVVASATTFTGNPETIRTRIEGGTTYWVEIRPFLNAVSEYTLEADLYDVTAADIPNRPYGVRRPAVGTPGSLLVSTMDPADPLQGYGALIGDAEAQVESTQSPYYGKLSGTSMSGPVLAGIAALVYDAYRQNHLEWPDPMDVINTIEATATQVWDTHEPYNTGAGFADAAAAVERAVEDDLASFDEVELADDTVDGFIATGDRSDNADAYTAGQTVRVDLEVEASQESVVRDRIPEGWTVYEEGDQSGGEQSGPDRFVYFDDVPAAREGETVTVSYFLGVPTTASTTGTTELGPAGARPADGGEFTILTDADTNAVVGADTS